MSQKKYLANPTEMAINSAYGVAFHRGLGTTLYPASNLPWKKYLDTDNLAEYAATAYSKDNFAIVANGVKHADLEKWLKEMFESVPSKGAYQLKAEQSKYYGGEERIAHSGGNAMVIALPGSSSPTGPFYKPEIAVLAALLGGQTTIKWSPGFSLLSKATREAPNMFIDTKSTVHSDAGLLTITMAGSASDIKSSAPKVAEALKSVASNIDKEAFAKAKALAKFKELEYGQETQAAMELTGAGLVHGGKAYQIDEVAKSVDGVTEEKVKQAAKEALEGKASVSAVGDLFALPFAEEIGLKV
jgi:ubiquinol-cytochrome c reductase core subunit 2